MKLSISPVFLFLVFLVLKLTHVITWSWLWVTSPLWLTVACTLGWLVVLGLFILLYAYLEKR